jgi:hypothetical protein
MSTDNGERTAAPIWRKPSDALVRNLLRAPIAGDCEQPIAPGRHKYRRFRHGSPSSPAFLLRADLYVIHTRAAKSLTATQGNENRE